MNYRIAPATALALAFVICHSSFVTAQGPLTPPGAPAPTMKSLDQIEPRTPITGLPFTISQPGSYYFTTNLVGATGVDGITVSADDVTIDLNGFSLIGPTPGGGAIGLVVPLAQKNLSVRNGTVRDWSCNGNVAAANARSSRFERLHISGACTDGLIAGSHCLVSDCTLQGNSGGAGVNAGTGSKVTGCAADGNFVGIVLGADGLVTGCTAVGNSSTGIVAGSGCALKECVAEANGGTGIVLNRAIANLCTARGNGDEGISAGEGCAVSGCSVTGSTNTGIHCGDGCEIDQCVTRDNGLHGIQVGDGSTVRHCTVTRNYIHGILSGSRCQILENNCYLNGVPSGSMSGIYLDGNHNRVEGNHVVSNKFAGIFSSVFTGGPSSILHSNLVIRNSAHGNTVDFQVYTTDTVGPIEVGSGTITTNNPWANFSY